MLKKYAKIHGYSILSMNSDNNTNQIGGKIRAYRMRSKLSQLELELAIGAASGSISRIENGDTNPTKETLSKIANYLSLKPVDVADLLGLKIYSTEELILAINTLSSSLDLDTTLQTAVDIMFGLFPNYNGGVLLRMSQQDKSELNGRTVSNMPLIERVHKILPMRISDYAIPIKSDSENLISKAAFYKKNFQGFKLANFTKGVLPAGIPIIITKLLGFQSGIAMPLLFQNELFGVALYTKDIKELFSNDEQRLLELLNQQIAIAIKNAEEYTKLKKELEMLRQNINEKNAIGQKKSL